MRYSINKINKLLNGKYICLSDNFINNKSILKWKCLQCNAVFTKSFYDLMDRKHPCKECYRIKKYDDLINKIKSYEGKCLSKFINTYSKLKFECKYGHVFYKKYTDVVNMGHWCPICSKSNNLSEEICREVFEKLFNNKFPTVRLKEIKSNKGYRLELDGYCAELNLAFEHQGQHHYDNKFRSVIDTQENDFIKINKCKELGITLIIIPTLFNKIAFSKLKKFIIDQCTYYGYVILNKNITIDQAYKKNIFYEKFQECQEKSNYYGGKCLSKCYLGATEKLQWECKFGHKWWQAPYVIKRGHWCPICRGRK